MPPGLRGILKDQADVKLKSLIEEIGKVGPFASYLINELAERLISPATVSRSAKRKLINDPIWKSIWLDEDELGILDQPLMQRLRYVRQLGLAFLVYPSAQHSRFEHSIGAVQAASRVLDLAAKRILPPEDYRAVEKLVRLAALLHDCGHCCFSHVGEEALGRHPIIAKEFESIERILSREFKDDVRTELSRDKQTAESTETSPKLPAIAELISALMVLSPAMSRAGQKLTISATNQLTIAALILGRSYEFALPVSGKLAYFANSIVSSDLDMDKIDYVARDAYFSGIPIACDVERLMSQLTLCEKNIKANGKDHTCIVLAILPSGVSNAEMFIFARAYLFERLYQHHKIRAAESRLRDVLNDHLSKIAPVEESLTKDSICRLCDLLFNPAGDDAVMAKLEESSPGFASSLRSYERLLALSIRNSVGYRHGKSDVDLLRIWPVAKTLMTTNRREFSTEISRQLGLPDGSILIDWQRPNPIKSFPEIYVTDRFDKKKFESIAMHFDISQMALAYHDVKSLGWVFTSDQHRERNAAFSAAILATKTGLCPLSDTFARCNLNPESVRDELEKLRRTSGSTDDLYRISAGIISDKLSTGPLVVHWKMIETFFGCLKKAEAEDLAAALSEKVSAAKLSQSCEQEFVAALRVAEAVFKFAVRNEEKGGVNRLSMAEESFQHDVEDYLRDHYNSLGLPEKNPDISAHQQASTGILDISIADPTPWHVVLELKAEEGTYETLIDKHAPQAFQYMTERQAHRIGVLFIRFKSEDQRRLSELITVKKVDRADVQRALICVGEHVPRSSASKSKHKNDAH